MKKQLTISIRHFAFSLLYVCVTAISVNAQVLSPDSDTLFEEDDKKKIEAIDAEKELLVTPDDAPTQDIDFKAPNVEFLQEDNVIKGSGGVLISTPDMQIQADEGQVDLDTKDSKLLGNVLIAAADGVIGAESADFNVETETGVFQSAAFSVEDGAYEIEAGEAHKLSERKYELADCVLTSCRCEDGFKPWGIHTDEAEITQEGYAHTYNTWMDFYGVPIFYTPYLAFPVKQERTSGLLTPTFGYGSEDGIEISLPIFAVIDDHTDMMFTPFTETKTRTGMGVDFRKAFSRESQIKSRLIYSNESARDGDLRGTRVNDIFDPRFDEDRFGGFFYQTWSNDPQSEVPLSLITDIHLISDDLFPREIEDREILSRSSRYATSTAVLRSSYGGFLTGELSGEYNQAITTDDDLVFQRLPELDLTATKSFRPFGFNPLGLKVVPKLKILATEFDRKEGFDGSRVDINPSLKIPFHYKNYLSSHLKFGLHQTNYKLDETFNPSTGTMLDDSTDRSVFTFEYEMSTGVERVYDLEEDNALTYLTSLGSKNQVDRLRRVKHTIEPLVRFNYIPDEEQDDLPLFDSLDRIREKNLITYGVRTRLLGRFSPKDVAAPEIVELAPRVEDLPLLTSDRPLFDFGQADVQPPIGNVSLRKGEIREIAALGLTQSYDYKEDKDNNDPARDALSDLGINLSLYPSTSFAMNFEGNADVEDKEFSSWGMSTHFRDDRGDLLRARYTFIDESVSQLEGNLELVLNEKFKLGYYGRYDDEDHEFIENRIGLRMTSACDCWHVDLGYVDTINPDKQQVVLNFTFSGIGDIAQGFESDDFKDNNE